jgi:hypothetical protein
MRMRILLDLSPETVDALNALALQSGKPRAEVIRRAVSSYVSAHVEPLSAFFGLWAENPKTQDVAQFVAEIRGEWVR